MSFFGFIILIVVFFTFRSTILSVKRDAELSIQHVGKSMVSGAAHLRAQIPTITDQELELLAHQEIQLKKLEKLNEMNEDELLAYFSAKEAKAKAKK